MSTRILMWRNAAIAVVAGCLLLVVLLGAWAVIFSPPVRDKRSPSLVTPSRRTTYITEPLRADGSVDYLAALNQRYGDGVTPDNNASVLIWQALGPGPQAEATRSAFFKAIGIPTPPENGDYFTPTAQFAREQLDAERQDSITSEELSRREEEIDDQLYLATTRAWATDEFPLVAAWLERNEKPLVLLIEATKRSRRFDPFVVRHDVPGQLLSADLPMASESRSITRALVARAMMQLKKGQIDGAWQDLLAVYRLARLVAQGATLVEGLIGIGIDGEACAGARAILQFTQVKSEQITRMRTELDELPPLASLVERLSIGDRFLCLDSVYSIAGQMSERTAAGEQPDVILQRALKSFGGSRIDWDVVFTRINARWDRYIAACHLPMRTRRKEACDRLEAEIRQTDGFSQRVTRLFESSEVASERMADLMIAVTAPAAGATCDAADRATMEPDLTRLAYALALYRASHGAFPESTDLLVPEFLSEVPIDIFASVPLLYQLADDGGYLLVSVGPDGVRDEASVVDPEDAEKSSDDLIVRMPAAGPRQSHLN